MSTLSFLAEEKEIKREERRLERREKLFKIWSCMAMWMVPWLTPAFMTVIVVCIICLGIWCMNHFHQ